MTSAQVVETSVTNNSSFQNYSHPDDHTIRTAKDNSDTAKNLILPLYTEAEDEDFWLFYCPGQTLETVHNARASAKLKGYWLDRETTENKYSILEHVSEIKVKWIIKTDHGPLYYERHLSVDANEEGFELPDIFKNCIRVTLEKYGFLSVQDQE